MSLSNLIILALAMFIVLLIFGASAGENRLNLWVQIFQATVTSVAIVLAGYWYFVERRGQPHADVSQTVQVLPSGQGSISIGNKAWLDRPRPSGQGFTPTAPYTGDPADENAVRAFVQGLAGGAAPVPAA